MLYCRLLAAKLPALCLKIFDEFDLGLQPTHVATFLSERYIYATDLDLHLVDVKFRPSFHCTFSIPEANFLRSLRLERGMAQGVEAFAS